MEYSIEIINQAAQQIAEMMKEVVNQEQEGNQKPVTIAQIEIEMRRIMREIGQWALGQFLSMMQTTPISEIECECGGRLQYQRMREATITSMFGKTQYKRAYYAGCRCQKGKAPIDEQFGIKAGSMTAGLAQLLALAGIAFSYEQSAQWLTEYLLFEISENTVSSETEQMGTYQEEIEEKRIKCSHDETCLQERQHQKGQVVERHYGSIDAAR